MKKFLKFLGALALAAIVVCVLLFKDQFGLGAGLGPMESDPAQRVSDVSQLDTAEDFNTASSPASSSAVNKGSNPVSIRIVEDRVFVDDEEVVNADDLKRAVEQKYTDKTVFELEESDSILATHEWVLEVFDELDIPLIGNLK